MYAPYRRNMDKINTTPVLTEPHANARAEILRLASIGEHPPFGETGKGQVWDYSFSRPNLNSTPIVGVCRYLDYLPNGKVINGSELAQILSLNKVVLFNWENGATDMRGGANIGAAHGREANRQLDALGIPKDVPIIYSADWDVQGNEYAAVEAYLRAAGAQGRPAGVYGKNDMVHQMLTRGAATIGWVTLAWQYHQPVSPLAHLYQDGVNSPNGTDHNIILKPYWGFYPNTQSTQGDFMAALTDDQQKELYQKIVNMDKATFENIDNSNPDQMSGAGVAWALNQCLLMLRRVVDKLGA